MPCVLKLLRQKVSPPTFAHLEYPVAVGLLRQLYNTLKNSNFRFLYSQLQNLTFDLSYVWRGAELAAAARPS